MAGLPFVGVGVLFLTTSGTAAGIPGLPDTCEVERAAQEWLQRFDERVPDLAVLGAVEAVAVAVLVRRARRDTSSISDQGHVDTDQR